MGRTEIKRIKLPCKLTEMESAIVSAGHHGYWDTARIEVDQNTNEAVIYIESDK